MDADEASNPIRVRVYDETRRYALFEYLTATNDISSFREWLGPSTRASEISPDEYQWLMSLERRWDEPIFRCLARCLQREGIMPDSLDREAVDRMMQGMDAMLMKTGQARSDTSIIRNKSC